jgi:hypothetical protein
MALRSPGIYEASLEVGQRWNDAFSTGYWRRMDN